MTEREPDGIVAAIVGTIAGGTQAFRTRLKLKVAQPASAQDQSGPPVTRPVDRTAPGHDDLTLIAGVSSELARELAGLGFRTFDSIAAWRRDEVRHVARSLGLGRAISRQNWIEQAALLMLPGADRPAVVPGRLDWRMLAEHGPALAGHAALHHDGTEVVPTAVPITTHATPSPMPAAAPVLFDVRAEPRALDRQRPSMSPAARVDRLEFIRGMDHGSEAMLRAGGITRPSQISDWTSEEVQRWRHRLGAGKCISAKCWIEQAAVLATGVATCHARAQLEHASIELIRQQPEGAGSVDAEPPLLARLAAITAAVVPAATDVATSFDAAMPGSAAEPGERLKAIERLVPIAQLLALPPLPLAPATVLPCETDSAADNSDAAPADFETTDVVIIQTGKANRQRPPTLVPKRPRMIAAPPLADRATGTLTARIETLAASRTRAAAGATVPHGGPHRPLDLSALDDLDVAFPQLGVGEADVMIVSSSTSAVGSTMAARMAARVQPTHRRAPGAAGSLEGCSIDAATYAAYRAEIAEASVEIVPVASSVNDGRAGSRVDVGRPPANSISRLLKTFGDHGPDPHSK